MTVLQKEAKDPSVVQSLLTLKRGANTNHGGAYREREPRVLMGE
jgi:hypothetical protein